MERIGESQNLSPASTVKIISIYVNVPRAERATVSPVHRSALLGQSLTWRPAGAGLLANAMRDRLGRLAAEWGPDCVIIRGVFNISVVGNML